MAMIIGAHVLLYSRDADADRAFLRDALGFTHLDAGYGWLIFGLPAAEMAVHPDGDGEDGRMIRTELYLMCDDVRAMVAALERRGIRCSAIDEQRWGLRTTITLPSGAVVGLYQPTHPTALALSGNRAGSDTRE